MVTEQYFSTTRSCYWWPKRKGEENGNLGTEAGFKDRDTQPAKTESDSNVGPQENRRKIQRRIYILGAGNLGKFVAHALAGIPNPPPMTLLFRRPGSLTNWQEQGSSIRVTTDGMVETRQGFEVELVPRLLYSEGSNVNKGPPREAGTEVGHEILQDNATEASVLEGEGEAVADPKTDNADGALWTPICNLMVSVKAPETVRAVKSVAHRLDRNSTILFLQNGMGIVDEVNAKVFPDEQTRPNYVVGVISHGVYSRGAFTIVHAGMGTTALGLLPRMPGQLQTDGYTPSAGYLLRTMTRTPVLAAVSFTPTDLLQMQLEKLAVNAIINPLTVMFDCKNGELLHNFSISRVMRLLLAEISLVIRSLPELHNVPNVQMRFGPDRLETQTMYIATRTAENFSSMHQDVQSGKMTEIDYITGYIIKRGEELGIKCVTNYMLSHMVKGKYLNVSKKDADLVPLRR